MEMRVMRLKAMMEMIRCLEDLGMIHCLVDREMTI
jgi:hypothetical protein